MKKWIYISLALLTVIVFSAGYNRANHAKAADIRTYGANSAPIDELAIHESVNNYRVTNNLQPLNLNYALQMAALVKCNDMLTNNYFAHVSPTGQTVVQSLASYIPDPTKIWTGQNLAKDVTSADQTYQGWLASPEHKVNFDNPNYTAEGVASCISGNTILVVEDFAQL